MLQPYKVSIVNKTPTQLVDILQNASHKDFNPIQGLFLPNFEVNELTEIFMASPETFNQLVSYYQKLGIEVKYSIKKGHEYLVSNQTYIINQGSPEFICSAVNYMVENCNQDEIYTKINNGDFDLTPADQFILENN